MLGYIALLSVSALITPLRPRCGSALRPSVAPARAAVVRCAEGESLDVAVARNPKGGLGILVDQENTVVTTEQPLLKIGDVVVGVDGELCNRRPLAECLTPGASEYTFSILRPSAAQAADSLEKVLFNFVKEQTTNTPGILCFAGEYDDENAQRSAERAEKLVASLEESAATGGAMPTDEVLGTALRSGFWRLLLVSDPTIARGGVTGYGLGPMCRVLGSYQAFIDIKEEQTAQVVEVIANANLGTSNVAALKGAWQLDYDAGTEVGLATSSIGVAERYERTEYGGQPEIDAPTVTNGWACTYLSRRLRVCRLREAGDGAGVWRVYAHLPADRAQDEIGRLMALPVERPANEPPEWFNRDDRLGGGGGGFGGGGGGGYGGGPMPEPMPERM